jgi:hypothetical protein
VAGNGGQDFDFHGFAWHGLIAPLFCISARPGHG